MAIEVHLKRLIDAQGTTMYAVAKATQLTYQTVYNLATKEISRIDIATLDKLCDVLGVEVGDILVHTRGQREQNDTPPPANTMG